MDKEYKGYLMFCGYVPFPIKAKNQEEALKSLQKKVSKDINEKEQKELLAHLWRLPKADRVVEFKKVSESDHERIRNHYKKLGEAIENPKRMRFDLASGAILQIEECFKNTEGTTTQTVETKKDAVYV